MKTSAVIAVAAALVGSASAQFSSIPPCALSCAIQSLGVSGCQATDIKCICQATSFIQQLTPCVQSACSATDFQNTLTGAQALCQSVGVTLSVPAGASTAASSASASTSAVAVTTSTSVVVSTTTTSTPAVTSSMTMMSSYVPSNSSSTTTAIVISSNGTVTTGSPTGTGTTSSPTASGTGNAAGRNAAAIGSFGAVLAFAALL